LLTLSKTATSSGVSIGSSVDDTPSVAVSFALCFRMFPLTRAICSSSAGLCHVPTLVAGVLADERGLSPEAVFFHFHGFRLYGLSALARNIENKKTKITDQKRKWDGFPLRKPSLTRKQARSECLRER
jgi:hypothetical protein